MILTFPQIEQIIKENPARTRVNKGIEYSKKLRKHMYGEKLAEQLEVIDGYEKPEARAVRAKYTKSNKDIFARLSRPMDKVFSAKGGSVYYPLPSESEKKAKIMAQDITNGYSVRKWVEMFWKPHMLDDPFGLIMMEILPMQEAMAAKNAGQSFAYPVYIPISGIYDYLPKGNRIEYLVIKLSAEQKKAEGIDEKWNVYRVVDDAFDYYVRDNNGTIGIIDGFTLTNVFAEVPAIVNSDLIDPSDPFCYLSFFDDIIEVAEQFLLKGSIKVTHDLLHGFPKYSEFADDCPACSGHRMVNGKNCEACKGTGKRAMTRVSDIKLLTWPSKDETVILPNQVGGYVSPDKTYYEISSTDLQTLEDVMTVTLWGAQSKLRTGGMSGVTANDSQPQTATEIMDDMKPQEDRLIVISEMAEKRHKFILDLMVRVNIAASYTGSSVSYGRRYMLESPDAIWRKYNQARKDSAPQSVLDDLLSEYYEAKYQSDPVGLEVAKKLMYLEPFVHYSTSVLKGLNPDPADYAAKLYFSEWLSAQAEGYILITSAEDMRKSLYEYAGAKTLKEEKEPIAA